MYSRLMFFRAASGNIYELKVETEHKDSYVPEMLYESQDGSNVYDNNGGSWNSLAEMTQDLRAEIKSWGSDVGD